MANEETKSGSGFEWLLFIVAIIVLCVGTYESVTQKYMPELCLLGKLHGYGYLTGYKIVYQPSRGIWFVFGWFGSAMLVVMMLYSVRKRVKIFRSFGALRHWLSLHIFLGLIGAMLVTFHTTFKFHGLIATSFWCMLTTVVFGVLGRYIYIQIPRSIDGIGLDVKGIDKAVEELDRRLGRDLKSDTSNLLAAMSTADAAVGGVNPLKALFYIIKIDIKNILNIMLINKTLKKQDNLDRKTRKQIMLQLKKRTSLISRKNLLATSHSLLHYWHVLHIPLALVMFLIMFLHIIVYYIFSPIA